MKTSKFFVELSLPCSYSDISIKHQLFPELMKVVYGRENPSGYINPEKEKQLDRLIADQYFFRYWLSERVEPNAYTGKDMFIRKQVPYESLIEDYMDEIKTDLNKQSVFQLLHSHDDIEVKFNDHYGSNSAYKCVKIAK